MEGVEDPFIDGDEWMMHHIANIKRGVTLV